MRVRNYFESCASEYEWEIILFLYVFYFCASHLPNNLAYNTKKNTIKSTEKFFLCAKETNRRGTKEIKNGNNGEKKYNIERVINYKSTFLFSFRLFRRDGAEI